MAINGSQALYIEEANLKEKTASVRVSKSSLDTAKFIAKEEDRSVRSVMDKALSDLRNKTPNPLFIAQDRKSDETKLNNTGETYE